MVRKRLLPLLSVGLFLACAQGGSVSTGPPPDVVEPPAGSPDPPYLPGLVAAAAGAGEARVDWLLPAAPLEAALFRSTVRTDVYDGPPLAEGLTGDSMLLTGLTDGVEYFLGLGVRAPGDPDYVPAGTILRVRPDAPIYVDASASAAGADGMSPATAFPDPRSAVLTAFAQGGGNVWIRDGRYGGATLPVLAGTHVYGGFGAGFALADRDVAAAATIFDGELGERLFDVQGGEPAAVLDGLVIAAAGLTTVGVDVTDAAAELRSLTISRCSDRGIRLRNSSTTDCLDVVVASCESRLNGADGLSATGAFDLRVDGCRFDSNAQEGFDLDDLVALEGGGASLRITGSRFLGNVTEGVDVDLAAPLVHGAGGGRFSVEIRGCRFELNGGAGLLLDEEYELTPGWTGDLVVRECTTRANGGSGIHVDADSVADILVHRVVSSANAGDGIWISSESEPGLAVVSASVVSGNLGAGMRASLGNQPIAASHCVFAGNALGGLVSEVLDSTATSCIAYLQPTPWQGAERSACVEVTDPLPPAFELVPELYASVVGRAGDTLTLSSASRIVPGSSVELADDQARLIAVQASGNTVVVDEEPTDFALPGLLTVFAPGAEVDEDYRLPAGSPALGAGLAPPGGAAVDAGPWGAPGANAPGVPNVVRGELFRVAAVTPGLSVALGDFDEIEVRFSGAIDAATATLDQVRAVTDGGTPLAIDFLVVDDTVRVMPPPGGWGGSPFFLELHADLRASSGAVHNAPLAIHVNR